MSYNPALPSPTPSTSSMNSGHLTDFSAAVDSHHSAATASIARKNENGYYTSAQASSETVSKNGYYASLHAGNITTPDLTPNTETPAPDAPTATPRSVTLKYGTLTLAGTLHLVSTEEYLTHYTRFMDIPTEGTVSFANAKDPVALMHSVQGCTWGLGSDMPVVPDGVLKPSQVGGFRALTDDAMALNLAINLGTCSHKGVYTPLHQAFENVILALPIRQPLGTHRATLFGTMRDVTEYAPRPVSREIIKAANYLKDVSYTINLGSKGDLLKQTIKNNLSPLVDQTTVTLDPKHPLHYHRNNLAIVDARIWRSFCTPSGAHKHLASTVPGLPEPYERHLFEDKRRPDPVWVPGCEGLVEEGWEDRINLEEMRKEVGRYEALIESQMTPHERREAEDGEAFMRWLMVCDP